MLKLILKSVLITPVVGFFVLLIASVCVEFIKNGYLFSFNRTLASDLPFVLIAVIFSYLIGFLPAAFGAVYLHTMRKFKFNNLKISLLWVCISIIVEMVAFLLGQKTDNNMYVIPWVFLALSAPGLLFINFESRIFNSKDTT